ncbi:hypothetical protein AAEZ42_05740 [Limosilactobacillus fermentum]
MTIKAIAVDMDGTFLNSQSDYDHDYFAKVYDLMVAKGFSSWWRRVTPLPTRRSVSNCQGPASLRGRKRG